MESSSAIFSADIHIKIYRTLILNTAQSNSTLPMDNLMILRDHSAIYLFFLHDIFVCIVYKYVSESIVFLYLNDSRL